MNGEMHPDDSLILERVRAFREGKNYGDLTFKFRDGILIFVHEKKIFKAIELDRDKSHML